MTPDQLRATLANMGLPSTRVTQCLGVEPRTIRSWLEGTRSIPLLVQRVLALVEAGRLRLEDLEAVAVPEKTK